MPEAALIPFDPKRRARALGLKQRTIAALLGASEQWVSSELRRRRPAVRIVLVIVAWGLMTPDQRGELLLRTGLGRLGYRQRVVTPHEESSPRTRIS